MHYTKNRLNVNGVISHLFDHRYIYNLLVSGLQNDHKALMKEIEEELYKIHAEARQKKGTGSSEETTTPEEETRARLSPFLILDKVDEDSPAHTCVMIQHFYFQDKYLFFLTTYYFSLITLVYEIQEQDSSYDNITKLLIFLSLWIYIC